MGDSDERIEYAIKNTEVLRSPGQTLATFGSTNIHYYLLTQPAYEEIVGKDAAAGETVIREGRVIAERPRVVTPHYLFNLEGFSENARRYLDTVARTHGGNVPGLFYSYKNEPGELNIVSSDLESVVRNIGEKIDRDHESLTTIIKGVDELWDVSLLKFIFDMTRSSVGSNVAEMGRRGLLDVDRLGIPRDARLSIERLFYQVRRGEVQPADLKLELERWGVFEEYQDRFLHLFKR